MLMSDCKTAGHGKTRPTGPDRLTPDEFRPVALPIAAKADAGHGTVSVGAQELRVVVIGRHGVQLEKGPARAVFLPQVAVEHGWTLDTLMKQLALKAGLADDGWRGAKFRVFEAQVFGEPKPSG